MVLLCRRIEFIDVNGNDADVYDDDGGDVLFRTLVIFAVTLLIVVIFLPPIDVDFFGTPLCQFFCRYYPAYCIDCRRSMQ